MRDFDEIAAELRSLERAQEAAHKRLLCTLNVCIACSLVTAAMCAITLLL